MESRTKRRLSSAVYRLSPPIPVTPNAPAAGLTRTTTLNPGSILLSKRLSRALRWCAFPAGEAGSTERLLKEALTYLREVGETLTIVYVLSDLAGIAAG